MKNSIENSEAMKRVWEWKENIYFEVKDLPVDEQFKIIHRLARDIREKVMSLEDEIVK